MRTKKSVARSTSLVWIQLFRSVSALSPAGPPRCTGLLTQHYSIMVSSPCVKLPDILQGWILKSFKGSVTDQAGLNVTPHVCILFS